MQPYRKTSIELRMRGAILMEMGFSCQEVSQQLKEKCLGETGSVPDIDWISGPQRPGQCPTETGSVPDRDWVSARQRLSQWPTKTGSVADRDWVSGRQRLGQWPTKTGSVAIWAVPFFKAV